MDPNITTLQSLISKPHQEKLFSFYAKLPIAIALIIGIFSVPLSIIFAIVFENAGLFFSLLISGIISAFLTYFCLAIPISYNILHIDHQKEICEKLTKLIENTTPKSEEQTTEEAN